MDRPGRERPAPQPHEPWLEDTQPYEWPVPGGRRASQTRRSRWPRVVLAVAAVLCVVVVAALLYEDGVAGKVFRSPAPAHTAIAHGATATATPVAFDPSVGAPLPSNRIVAAYGLQPGGESDGSVANGPASSLGMLDSFLPQLQQLGSNYAALDPTHPVMLGIDLVVNVFQPCTPDFPYCSSWENDDKIDQYIAYCQQHHLLLFFDLQLGTEPVVDAVTNHLLPYLEKYPFTELALDTEFHFPNTPDGQAEAEAAATTYCCRGWMDASEVNWAVNELAQISLQYHLPRKVLIVNQFVPDVLPDKDQIQRNPNVSLVVQMDGHGGPDDKLFKYQLLVQQDLLEYGGYKLFLPYDGDSQSDDPLQSPQDVMQLFPQPLFVSYQ